MHFTSKIRLLLALLLLTVPLFGRSYSTTFPATENPICEGSPCNWDNAGHYSGGWANVRTTSGVAYNTTGGGYLDAAAFLTGTWGPNQTVEAVAKCGDDNAGEIEIRLRSAMSNNNNRGYEVFATCRTGSYGHLSIVRWNGAPQDFTYLTNCEPNCSGQGNVMHSGDTMRATITTQSGSNVHIEMWIKRSGTSTFTKMVWADDNDTKFPRQPHWYDGNPGIGFDDNANNSNEGWASFTATDGSVVVPPTGLSAVPH